MLPRIVRPATATALVASCVLAGTSASARVSAAPTTQPFAGQTISVAYASTPPPKRLLDQFKARTGITVNWTNVGWDDLQTKITAAAMAHAYLADVTDVDWSRVGQYYRLKWFQPLNTSFNVDSLKSDVPQLSSFIDNGTLVGMPADSSFTVTTINMRDLRKAGVSTIPRTFTQYAADLKRLQSAHVVASPLDIPFSAAEGLSTYWYQMTAAFGGTMLDRSFHPLFTSPSSAGYRALAWMVAAYKSGLVPKANINMADSQGMQDEMALGRVASIFSDYSGNVGSLYNVPSASHVTGDVQYIPIPGVNGAAPNLGNPDGMGIPVGAHNPGAAATFIRWFTDPTNQARWAGLDGSTNVIVGFPLPMRLTAFKMLTKAGKLDQGALLADLLGHHAQAAFPYGIPPWYTRFSAAVNTNIHSAALGSESVATAINAIASTVNSLNG
jgi:multiple sugar transport system substrate-binding protein